jgi:hypothetical protein
MLLDSPTDKTTLELRAKAVAGKVSLLVQAVDIARLNNFSSLDFASLITFAVSHFTVCVCTVFLLPLRKQVGAAVDLYLIVTWFKSCVCVLYSRDLVNDFLHSFSSLY